MHKELYSLRAKVEALAARVDEVERLLVPFRPSFRERAVKKTSKPGLDAEQVVINWLQKKGHSWEDREELTKILRNDEGLRLELLDYIRDRGSECSSQSWSEVTNFLRSINPIRHQND